MAGVVGCFQTRAVPSVSALRPFLVVLLRLSFAEPHIWPAGIYPFTAWPLRY